MLSPGALYWINFQITVMETTFDSIKIQKDSFYVKMKLFLKNTLNFIWTVLTIYYFIKLYLEFKYFVAKWKIFCVIGLEKIDGRDFQFIPTEKQKLNFEIVLP